MLLDFSKYTSHEIIQTPFYESWQIEIVEFIKNWADSSASLKIQTSGSTGKPKIFSYPKNVFIQSAQLTGWFLNLKKGNSALLCLPIKYIAGKMMIIRAIELQLKLFCILPSSTITLTNEIDFCAMAPMQVSQSLDYIVKIKKLIIGGMPISLELEKKLQKFPNTIYETFGMTETLSHIALKQINSKDTKDKAFSLLPNFKIRKNKNDCLVIKTPFFMEEIITNDIVELIDEKSFIWKGRADNVINSGGIKIFPEEIEKKLQPFIRNDFYIISAKDVRFGEVPVLIIEDKTKPIFETTIFKKAQLTKYETPKEIMYKNEFTYTKSGKISRDKF